MSIRILVANLAISNISQFTACLENMAMEMIWRQPRQFLKKFHTHRKVGYSILSYLCYSTAPRVAVEVKSALAI